ncbi:hypothetical protein K0M31_006785 [Melipona bicolor]|uniref:Uncharacterized protein n=1 Tax=Melipona bicolor TaxID=60889 RepID=A0AA40KL42_9HYME|nr:hypothetical protein K0M31_006785 [Melipona bicolor]
MSHVDKSKLKRKKPLSFEDAASCSRNTTPEDPSSISKNLLYPPTHEETAVVVVKLIKNELKRKKKDQNFMFIARIISSLKAGALNMCEVLRLRGDLLPQQTTQMHLSAQRS